MTENIVRMKDCKNYGQSESDNCNIRPVLWRGISTIVIKILL